MSKYDALYFVGHNQAINRVRVDSSKMRNRGTFSGSLAALVLICMRQTRHWSLQQTASVEFMNRQVAPLDRINLEAVSVPPTA